MEKLRAPGLEGSESRKVETVDSENSKSGEETDDILGVQGLEAEPGNWGNRIVENWEFQDGILEILSLVKKNGSCGNSENSRSGEKDWKLWEL